MQVKKQQLELDMEQQTGLFNLHAECIMRNAQLDEAQAGRNINNLRYADDTTLMAESEEELKRLFGSSSISAIKVVSSAYLRLLIFLPPILIPACASSIPAFRMMYSAYKLNKQGDNISLDVLFSQFGTSVLFHELF